jgi:hypothetical protein
MAEVLQQFESPVLSYDKRPYRAQACGAATKSGTWEGWIEFIPVEGGKPVRSPRETTQPNRIDTVYWASGLSPTYLEGALARALREPVVMHQEPPPRAVFDSPRPGPISSATPALGQAILDPFSVYEKGEGLLRQELGALSAWHLVNIIVVYRLGGAPAADLNRMPQGTLIEMIVAGVRAQNAVR